MEKFKTIICAIFICSPCSISISKENDIKVIVDVIQSFKKPSDVIATLNWTTTDKNILTDKLAQAEIPRSIKFVKDIHAKDLVYPEKIIFMSDVIGDSVEFLYKAVTKKYFGRPYRWIIINRPAFEFNIPLEIDDMHMLPDSEVYVMQLVNDSYKINLVYKITANHAWIIENYGNWSTIYGLSISGRAKEALAMKRRNLARATIVTSTVVVDNATVDDLEALRYKEIDSIAKCGYHQLAALYEFMNASREIILTKEWGYRVNGTWHGMIGHLVDGTAELAGAVLFITKDRMPIIEYLSHPIASAVKFIFREPPLSYQNNLYLLPFRASVWCCIGSFVVVLIGAMYVSAYWEGKKSAGDEHKPDGTHEPVLVPKISDVTVFVMSAISQQGSNVELKGMLGRFVIFILFLVFVFLYTAYSASIVVLLQSSSNQIRTLTDLLNSKLELGVEDTPYNRYWFMNEKEPIRRAIYEKKIAPSGSKPKFFDLTEGVLQLQKKPFALNCNLGVAYRVIERYFYEHEKCGLQEISYIQDDNPWQAVRRGSPYREIFKIGLLRNAEFGLNDRTNRIMFSKKPVCSVRGGSFVSVSLVDCYPILLLLIYGMILGVVLLLVEILHHRKMLSCKNSSQKLLVGTRPRSEFSDNEIF
ncbi:ionotropic receptor 75a-like [Leguminivora glycinivorella]|uniref:ionotropic receptor 75a-like n=1 Tax=Leguminivora glycinivorella TaxID=1035111 RepID=UPI00200CB474|nr:ionotropic receptor 75a-like [Leguminivora glycinivorella]